MQEKDLKFFLNIKFSIYLADFSICSLNCLNFSMTCFFIKLNNSYWVKG